MFDLNYYDMLRKKEKLLDEQHNFYSRKKINDNKRLITENNIKSFKELKENEFIILSLK